MSNFLTANIAGLESLQSNEPVLGYQYNRIVAVLSGLNPLPLSTGSLTILVGGLNMPGPLVLTASPGGIVMQGIGSATIIGGTTGLSIMNNANNATNVAITDLGAMTLRAGLTVSAGGASITGGLTVASGNFSTTGTTTFGGLAYTWPGAQSASQLLQTDGFGVLSWQTIISGVSSVSGTANQITVSPTSGATVVGLATSGTLPGSWTAATGFTVTTGGLTVSAGGIQLTAGVLHAGAGVNGGAGTGDIVARRAATTGGYYFGDSGTTYLFFDGANYTFSGGGLVVSTGGLTVSAGGITVSAGASNFTGAVNALGGNGFTSSGGFNATGSTSYLLNGTAALGISGTTIQLNAGAFAGGVQVVSGGLTVTTGGLTVTGASTITGTLGGITTLTATTLAGTLSTAAQPNITSVGTLTSLAMSGALTGVTTGAFSGAVSMAALTATTGTFSGTVSGVTTLTATTLAGTLSTAAQANVTSLGTLSSLTTSGTITITAGVSKIVPGATSLSLRNNADNADNLILTDAGAATFRSTVGGITTLTATSVVAALTGNASTASALQTPRAINTVNFDGTAAITVTAAAGTLTGTTLAANVVTSSLTTTGILAALHMTSPVVDSGGLTVTAGGILAQVGAASLPGLSLGSNNLGVTNPRLTFYDDATNASYVTYDAGTVTYFRATGGIFKFQSVPTGSTRFSGAGTDLLFIQSISPNLTIGNGLTVSAGGITVTGASTITGTLGGITTLTATTLVGTLSTAAQPNITSLGTVAALVTSGTTTFNGVAYTWPATAGTNTYVLSTNGSGTLSWNIIPAAPVTSVSGTTNQVTASPTTGAVVVSLPSGGTLPGSWAAATGFTVTTGGATITGGLTLPKGAGLNSAYIGGGAVGDANTALALKNDGGAADAKFWDFQLTANTIQFRATNDGYSSANAVWQVTRSGFSVTAMTINPALTLGAGLAMAGAITGATTGSFSGAVSMAALTATTGTFSGTVSGITTLTATTLAGTLSTVAQPNVTSTGILAALHMTSPVIDSGGLIVTAGAVTINANQAAGSLTLGGGDSSAGAAVSQIRFGYSGGSSYPHFLTTQHNAASAAANRIKFWTSDGTSAGVFPTNAILALTLENGTATVASGLTVSAGGITVTGTSTITGTLGGITTLTATTLAGTLSTAAQPNVTSLGTIAALVTSGTTTLNGVAYTWPATAGTNTYVLSTNGSGTLSWNIIPAAPVSSVSGTTNQVTASPTTGAVVVSLPSSGTLPGAWSAATGFTITAGGLAVTGGITGSGGVNVGNVTGTLQTAAQPNITSVGTLTSLAMSGALTGVTTGAFSGAVSMGALTATTGNFSSTLAATNNLNLQGTTQFSIAGPIVSGQTDAPSMWFPYSDGSIYLDSPQVIYFRKVGTGPGTFLTLNSPTLATFGGALTIAGALTGATTGAFSGAVSMGALTATTGAFSGTVSGVTTLTATTLAGTLSTAAQANVTSLGTLTSLTTSGTITMTAAISKIVPGATSLSLRNNADNADNLILTDAGAATFRSTVSGITTLTATTLAGTLSTAAQPNVTSVGTLTSLSTGAITLTGGITGSGGVNVGNVTGTLQTAAQPNITSVGTLTSLVMSGGLSGATTGAFSGAVSMAGLTATTGTFSSTVSMTGLTATTGSFSGAVDTGLLRNSTAANASPYTQARVTVYGGTGVDATNWGYFAYGSDAQMRVVYSKTSAANTMLFGMTSAYDNTGVFTETARLDSVGKLTLTGALAIVGAITGATTGAFSGAVSMAALTATTGTFSGTVSGVTTLTATTLAGTLSTAAQPNITSVGTLTSLAMSGAISGVTTLTATTLAGTLSTAAQANVTSLGTLSSLTVTGDLTENARIVMGAAVSKIVPGATSLSLRNNADNADNLILTDAGAATFRSTVGGISILTATTLAGTLSTAAQPNITSVGTLTSLVLSGAISGVTTLTATTLTGTLSTAAQANVTSLGTLTSLTVSGDITEQARLVFTATASKIVPGATSISLRNNADNADNLLITDAGAATFRSTVSGITTLTATTLTGTLSTAAQANITSVGTLTSLSTGAITLTGGISGSGGVNVGNVTGTLQTAAQPNITSTGILAALHMTSPVVDSGGLTITSGSISVASGNAGIGTGVLSWVGLALFTAVSGTSVVYGIQSSQTLTLAGASSSAYGQSMDITVAIGTLSVSAYYGLRLGAPNKTGAGTIANVYNLYVDSPIIGTNNYALYTNGTAASVFGGAVSMAALTATTGTFSADVLAPTGRIIAGATPGSFGGINGDILANRGGATPGTGAVFFGSSTGGHNLYYDGSKFNFTDGVVVTTGALQVGSAFPIAKLATITNVSSEYIGGDSTANGALSLYAQLITSGGRDLQLLSSGAGDTHLGRRASYQGAKVTVAGSGLTTITVDTTAELVAAASRVDIGSNLNILVQTVPTSTTFTVTPGITVAVNDLVMLLPTGRLFVDQDITVASFINVTRGHGLRIFDGAGVRMMEFPTAIATGIEIPAAVKFSKSLAFSDQTPASAATVTIDSSVGDMVINYTLTANQTFGAPTNGKKGQFLCYTLVQGGAGGFTVTWNAVFLRVTWSDAGNAVNTRSSIMFVCLDGTNWLQVGAQRLWA